MQKRIYLPLLFLIFTIFIFCGKKNNDPPTLSDIIAPDSLVRGDTLAYEVSVLAIDPDGADDIDSVFFIVTRPDSSSNNIHFAMNDAGQMGDITAGDNRYTQGIQAPGPQNLAGDYTFTFYCTDKHGNKSNSPAVIITAY